MLTFDDFNSWHPLTPSPSQNISKYGINLISNIQFQSSTRNPNRQTTTLYSSTLSRGTYINNHTCALRTSTPFTSSLCVLSDGKEARRPIKLDWRRRAITSWWKSSVLLARSTYLRMRYLKTPREDYIYWQIRRLCHKKSARLLSSHLLVNQSGKQDWYFRNMHQNLYRQVIMLSLPILTRP